MPPSGHGVAATLQLPATLDTCTGASQQDQPPSQEAALIGFSELSTKSEHEGERRIHQGAQEQEGGIVGEYDQDTLLTSTK